MIDVLRPLSLDFESMVDTLREPLLVLSADLRVQKASRSFYRTFKVEPEKTVGQIVCQLGNQRWRISDLLFITIRSFRYGRGAVD